MAQLPAIFNPSAEGQESLGDFSPIPTGDYIAYLEDSEMKLTKENIQSAQYLECKWKILQGEFEGRFIWARLNLVNPNTTTVEIAQKHLKSMCDATGQPGPISDTQALHMKPIMIRVVKKPADLEKGFGESNEIKGYKALEEQTVPTGSTSDTNAMVAAANTKTTDLVSTQIPPWKVNTPNTPETPVENQTNEVHNDPQWLKRSASDDIPF